MLPHKTGPFGNYNVKTPLLAHTNIRRNDMFTSLDLEIGGAKKGHGHLIKSEPTYIPSGGRDHDPCKKLKEECEPLPISSWA